MTMQRQTPAQAARFVFNLTGGKAQPDKVAESYRSQAETMREYAKKAAKKPNGKHNGYTLEQCVERARIADFYAIEVPIELAILQASA